MKVFWGTLAVMGCLLATPVLAQEATGEGGDDALGISMGETLVDGRQVGEEYVKETFGDWAHRCVTTANGEDPCQTYQLLLDGEGNSVAEISIIPLAPGGNAAAGGTIVTPLETLLTRAVTLQVDAGPQRRYPFTFCARSGCISRVGFTDEDLSALKAGAAATLTIVPAGAPTSPVELNVSLTGFTAAFDAMEVPEQ
ncbi:MAG: invasion associated locus B family protein [Pseudomonadota bacterium]